MPGTSSEEKSVFLPRASVSKEQLPEVRSRPGSASGVTRGAAPPQGAKGFTCEGWEGGGGPLRRSCRFPVFSSRLEICVTLRISG